MTKTETPKTQTGNETSAKADGVVLVTSPKPRYRAGLKFGPEPTEVDLGKLKKTQVEAIQGDARLMVKPKGKK